MLQLLRSLADEGRVLVVATHDDRLLPFADQVLDMHRDGIEHTGHAARQLVRS